MKKWLGQPIVEPEGAEGSDFRSSWQLYTIDPTGSENLEALPKWLEN